MLNINECTKTKSKPTLIFKNCSYITTLLHPFNGLFSRTTWVSRHRKVNHSGFYWSKRWCGGSGINWTICRPSAPCSRHITTPSPHHSVFTGRMPFLPPNQQRQSTEGKELLICMHIIVHNTAQNSSDNFPLILQTIIVAQMMGRGTNRQYQKTNLHTAALRPSPVHSTALPAVGRSDLWWSLDALGITTCGCVDRIWQTVPVMQRHDPCHSSSTKLRQKSHRWAWRQNHETTIPNYIQRPTKTDCLHPD